ncbi:hypothetical protein SKAU_G00420860 [Synaphobranchus kaupii]|uniref:ZP domain-containing protein n=1 Tax=Synaphobranchus kaupii TaxID=118154 RepID=A0A9Q1E6T7_SYNKA|nr:hypothetical protein SKAU_G00420860 [Synaphobranchus kaupii]
MIIMMNFSIGSLCIVWSLVLLGLAGPTEAYESALRSITKNRRKWTSHTHTLRSSDFGQSEAQSTTGAKNRRVELSNFQTRFPVPRVIERLQLAAEELPPAVLSRALQEAMTTSAPAPAPRAWPAALPDVSVNCSSTEFTVRVKRDFYGFAVTPSELTLGRTCKSNGVDEPSGDLLFTYPLTACDRRQAKVPGYVLYNYILHFLPEPTNLPVQWAHGFPVDIECRIKSIHRAYQLAIRPKWATPRRKTLQGQMPGYGIQTMNAEWTATSPSNIFFLGQKVHFQVYALSLPPGGKLYIDHCYLSLAQNPQASPEHPVIENYGCMVDSTRDGSNSGFFQRTNGTINFVLKAVQFVQKPAAEVFLHCQLFVAVGDPTSTAKSCTFSKEDNRWKEISGSEWECECCKTQCLLSEARRSMHEGLQSSGPLIFASLDPEPKISTPPALHTQGEAVWSNSGMEEEEEEEFEDSEWPGDYEYTSMYEEDHYRGDGSHAHSTGDALQSGDGEGPGGENVGSTLQKEVMEMGFEEEEWPAFGDEVWPVFTDKMGEGPVFGGEEELDEEVVPTFKAVMMRAEKTGKDEDWPVFELGEGLELGEETTGEGEWPMLTEEELQGKDEGPTWKAVVGMGKGVVKIFGEETELVIEKGDETRIGEGSKIKGGENVGGAVGEGPMGQANLLYGLSSGIGNAKFLGRQ